MGFDDVFSQSRLGTTEWERRIQYNQALQGELARAIEMMKSVERAKVYIVTAGRFPVHRAQFQLRTFGGGFFTAQNRS